MSDWLQLFSVFRVTGPNVSPDLSKYLYPEPGSVKNYFIGQHERSEFRIRVAISPDSASFYCKICGIVEETAPVTLLMYRTWNRKLSRRGKKMSEAVKTIRNRKQLSVNVELAAGPLEVEFWMGKSIYPLSLPIAQKYSAPHRRRNKTQVSLMRPRLISCKNIRQIPLHSILM